jgi:hypothetical protein
MEIVETGYLEYQRIVTNPYHIFGGAAFNHLNEDKADAVHYLLFKEGKYRLGIIGGIRNNVFCSPFSAPFGGFSFLQKDVRISYIDEAAQLLSTWASSKGIGTIKITLPPAVYQESFLSKQVNSLYRNEYVIEKTDLNYAYDLTRFNENYAASIWFNARKNLKIALANDFSFKLCKTAGENETAYNIIKKNREARGFPLRMTWEQVQLSTSVIPADFFLVLNSEQLPVAAAVVFHLNQEVVQVIYWGDLPEYASQKTNSIPNFGLCEFKESIGCDISCKFSFSKSIT